MDLVSTPCTLFKRTPKKLDCSFLFTRQLGITTPIQQRRKDTQTTSPNYKRHHTQFEKKYEDKGVNCDFLFDNIQINQTFQHNTPKLDYEYTKMQIREMRVLSKRDHGLTVFKPVPSRMGNKTLQTHNTLNHSSRKRKSQQRTIMDADLMKSSVEKEKLFSDRNCRVYLNDLWCDSYRE